MGSFLLLTRVYSIYIVNIINQQIDSARRYWSLFLLILLCRNLWMEYCTMKFLKIFFFGNIVKLELIFQFQQVDKKFCYLWSMQKYASFVDRLLICSKVSMHEHTACRCNGWHIYLLVCNVSFVLIKKDRTFFSLKKTFFL